MSLSQVHRDPTGQVSLYQTEDRYFRILERRFGRRFLDYRRRWRETSERGDPGDFPLSLDLALNSGCQLNCVMCPLPGRPERRRVRLMPPETFERLMIQAEEHRLPALTLGLASEPLLHPLAAARVGRAVKAGIMDIRLGSNGLALGDDLSQALIDSGLTRLEISVDAVRPETYRAIRGGDLAGLERAIDRFLELRLAAGLETPLLRLSFLRLEVNQGELEAFLERWQGRADLISIQEPIWFPGSALPRPNRTGQTELGRDSSPNPAEPLQPNHGRNGPPPLRGMAPACAQSWQRLGVDHDGRVWPCCSWYGENLLPFNVNDHSPAHIWRSPEMEALRQALSGAPDAIPPACRQCEF